MILRPHYILSSSVFLISGFFLSLFGAPVVRAQALVPSCSDPSGLVEKYEIDPRFEPRQSFDQKTTPTCFAQSSTFLLQYLVNSHGDWLGQSAARTPDLSVVDVIAQANQNNFLDGGTSFEVLHRLRNHRIAVDQGLDIEAVWEFNSEFLLQSIFQFQERPQWLIRESLPEKLKELIPEWEKKVAAFPGVESLDQTPYQFLDFAMEPERVSLPPFNLHVFDPSSESLKVFVGDLSEDQETIFLKAIHKWFQTSGSSVVPLEATYCEVYNDSEQACEGLHSITLVGLRTHCDLEGHCSDSWRVRGSWGGEKDGWFEALPLARAILAGHASLSYIQPCWDSKRSERRRTGESCLPQILGLTLDRGNRYSASHPLHYLASAHDEDLFFELIEQLRVSGQLDTEIKKRVEFSKTLGHVAVSSQSNRILTWIAKNYPEVLWGLSENNSSAAHLAVSSGSLDAVKILWEWVPGLFNVKDQGGFLPSDWAALKVNLVLLENLHKLNPKLIVTKNGLGWTPLELLKIEDRDAYRRFKKTVYPWYQRLWKKLKIKS